MYIVYRINKPCQLFTFSFKADGKSIGLTVAYTFQNENSKIEKKKKSLVLTNLLHSLICSELMQSKFKSFSDMFPGIL